MLGFMLQEQNTIALIHFQAWVFVGNENDQHWKSRGHFLAAAAQAMRRILVDNAQRKQTEKHGENWVRHPIEDRLPSRPDQNVIALDDALARLADNRWI
ncbi:MAG: ECF-type sigma factor [Pirellulaceae bacterium]|nr:ECF-type sigma factor [Pirellulaceae bacterium]